MLTLMGFGQTSLSGVRRGCMPPQLKKKNFLKQDNHCASYNTCINTFAFHRILSLILVLVEFTEWLSQCNSLQISSTCLHILPTFYGC
jgi:hypothetical protein